MALLFLTFLLETRIMSVAPRPGRKPFRSRRSLAKTVSAVESKELSLWSSHDFWLSLFCWCGLCLHLWISGDRALIGWSTVVQDNFEPYLERLSLLFNSWKLTWGAMQLSIQETREPLGIFCWCLVSRQWNSFHSLVSANYAFEGWRAWVWAGPTYHHFSIRQLT